MSFLKKTVVWLGLNEEYPTDDRAIVEPPRPDRPQAQQRPTPAPQPHTTEDQGGGRRVEPRPVSSSTYPDGGSYGESSVRVVPLDMDPSDAVGPSPTVRAMAAPMNSKPQLIVPSSFNDAQSVADAYKDGKPVIVNMQTAERDLARRLIDFSSGLCYGLGGQMERVADQVYLLTPDNVTVSDEERERFSSE